MERYSRQVLALGLDLQERLSSLRVLIVGCGALGSSTAEILARMGVGEIKLVDPDVVELSNLHRTRMFTEEDLGKPKVVACRDHLSKINSNVKVVPIADALDSSNAKAILRGVDVILDGLDNNGTRLAINDAAVKLGVPLIYGGVMGEYGSAMLIVPGETPCLSCFLEPGDEANTCETMGVSPVIVELIAAIQAQLLLSLLRGYRGGELISVDASRVTVDKVKINRNPMCQACSLREFRYLKGLYVNRCGLERVDREGEEKVLENEYVRISFDGSWTYVRHKANGLIFRKRG